MNISHVFIVVALIFVLFILWKYTKPNQKPLVIVDSSYLSLEGFKYNNESYRLVCECSTGCVIYGDWWSDKSIAYDALTYSMQQYPELECKVEIDYGPPRADRIAW